MSTRAERPACLKCRTQPGEVQGREGPASLYCRPCFLSFGRATFQDTLMRRCGMPLNNNPRMNSNFNNAARSRGASQAASVSADGPAPPSEERALDSADAPGEGEAAWAPIPVTVAVDGSPGSLFALHTLLSIKAESDARAGDYGFRYVFLPFYLDEEELLMPPIEPAPAAACEEAAATIAGAATLTPWQRNVRDVFARVRALLKALPRHWKFTGDGKKGGGGKGGGGNGGTPRSLFPAVTGGSTTAADRLQGRVTVVSPRLLLSAEEGGDGGGRAAAVARRLHDPRVPFADREDAYARLKGRLLPLAARTVADAYYAASAAPRPPAGRYCFMVRGDDALQCAAAALTQVMSGAGGNYELQRCAAARVLCHPATLVLRPCRTLLPREVLLYCRLAGVVCAPRAAPAELRQVPAPALRTCCGPRPSIRAAAGDFLAGLLYRHNFRNMVANVLTVVDARLAPRPEAAAAVTRHNSLWAQGGGGAGAAGSKRARPPAAAGTAFAPNIDHSLLAAAAPPAFPTRRDELRGDSARGGMCALCSAYVEAAELAAATDENTAVTAGSGAADLPYILCHSCRPAAAALGLLPQCESLADLAWLLQPLPSSPAAAEGSASLPAAVQEYLLPESDDDDEEVSRERDQ